MDGVELVLNLRKLFVGFPKPNGKNLGKPQDDLNAKLAFLLDQLEEMGVVGPSLGGGKERDVLLPAEDEELEDKE